MAQVGLSETLPHGRALHPPWTHAPLGGLLAAAVFDVISTVDGSTHSWARELYRAGTFVLMVSTSVMALAIVSGLVDRYRATTEGTPLRARTNQHGAVMGLVAVGSVVDLAVRRSVYPHASHAPGAVLTVTVAVLLAALVGGEIGGRLTYRGGVNVASRLSRRGDVDAAAGTSCPADVASHA